MTQVSLLLALLVPLSACGDDAPQPDGRIDMAHLDLPPPPTLGRAIVRTGRAALAALLVDPFNLEAGRSPAALQTAYRSQGDPGSWSQFVDELTASLPIWDSLDGICGNQLGAESGDASAAYIRLADALADDRLYVDTSQTSCAAYFGIEANALSALDLKDCGGRTPTMDTVDGLFSILVDGAAEFSDPSKRVEDGIPAALPRPSNTQFPFFQPPD